MKKRKNDSEIFHVDEEETRESLLQIKRFEITRPAPAASFAQRKGVRNGRKGRKKKKNNGG